MTFDSHLGLLWPSLPTVATIAAGDGGLLQASPVASNLSCYPTSFSQRPVPQVGATECECLDSNIPKFTHPVSGRVGVDPKLLSLFSLMDKDACEVRSFYSTLFRSLCSHCLVCLLDLTALWVSCLYFYSVPLLWQSTFWGQSAQWVPLAQKAAKRNIMKPCSALGKCTCPGKKHKVSSAILLQTDTAK